jgi:hypothetical protein
MGPKEDPQDKAARLRERRLGEIDRNNATQANTRSMTQELAAIYGLRGNMGSFMGVPK